jgi:hypothetical protein
MRVRSIGRSVVRATGQTLKRARPTIVDARMVAVVAIAFAAGVFFVIWNRQTLRLEYAGQSVAWPILVSFGMVWLAGRSVGWRTGAGLVFGTVTALAGLYGGMSVLPASSAMVLAGWLGVVAGLTALVSHLLPRVLSFPAAAVGYGVGLGLGASTIRPVTAASDWATLLTTAVTAMVLGAFGAQALRTLLLAFTGTPDALKTAPIVLPKPAGATAPTQREPRHALPLVTSHTRTER